LRERRGGKEVGDRKKEAVRGGDGERRGRGGIRRRGVEMSEGVSK